MKTVNEVAKISGVSRRTIQYYDQIGLLKPSHISKSGYRLYDDKALEILQQILIFKELAIPLKDIKRVLDNPNLDKIALLKSHKKLIVSKKNHLTELISLIDKIIKEPKLMIFADFNMQRIEQKIERNFEILKNSDNEAYNMVLKESGLDSEQLMESIKKSVRKNQDIITTLYGSLDQYCKALDITAERMDERYNDAYKMQNLLIEFFKMKDKEVSCSEVQKLISEINALNIKISGEVEFQKSREAVKLIEAKLSSSPDELKKYKEATIDALKKLDEVYGEGSYEFYTKAMEYYYLEHKQ